MHNLYNLSADSFLVHLMNTNAFLKNTISQDADLNIQIIYTKIDRDENNQPTFTDYTYHLNNKNYFYPASTVKMPIAFLALEKINELKKYGVDKNSVMVTDSSNEKQSIIYTEPTAENSSPSIAHYIKQIFLVSDNNAFNRLYEFLGQEYIQQKLKSKGYPDAVIRHRLDIILTPEQNKATNAVSFYDTLGNVLYTQPAQYSKAKFASNNAKLGKGYYKGNQLINEPFDFALKNKLYLQDLHNILRSVIFNEYMPSKSKFNLTQDDYDFLLHWMSAYPKESKYPYYDSTKYWDNYCKFLLRGSAKQTPSPDIRIFSKAGDAYGFLTDVAYIIDKKNNLEFMLSATISCNSDGIYNDDKYDYETLGLPFMKNLGQTIYDYELNRKKQYPADLTKFNFSY
jgi:hypothetical protein